MSRHAPLRRRHTLPIRPAALPPDLHDHLDKPCCKVTVNRGDSRLAQFDACGRPCAPGKDRCAFHLSVEAKKQAKEKARQIHAKAEKAWLDEVEVAAKTAKRYGMIVQPAYNAMVPYGHGYDARWIKMSWEDFQALLLRLAQWEKE